ncbi:ferritin-like domain-containing protein [Lutibaculum baratangense]|uniref:Protein yciE n=1 Tax=Lutibaculum baratangense AMV1 TaxID=631454 RepID=V4TAC4_9HYPH|nr:ferritin-like domain-containing protein [Lutibaculum baratangense]ESR23388.1 Protein yciE [Lutibaculum baratangense AMV1]
MAAKDTLAQWLRDAHAMEEQAKTMLDAQSSRIEHYPELKARIEQHLKETERQEEKLRGCLDRLGGTSAMKDAGAKMTAMMQGMGGMFAGDEVVKGAMASYAFEHFEISAYRSIIGAAEIAGEPEVKAVAEEILLEEEAMATWLYDHLPTMTRQYLEREQTGSETAKR